MEGSGGLATDVCNVDLGRYMSVGVDLDYLGFRYPTCDESGGGFVEVVGVYIPVFYLRGYGADGRVEFVVGERWRDKLGGGGIAAAAYFLDGKPCLIRVYRGSRGDGGDGG